MTAAARLADLPAIMPTAPAAPPGPALILPFTGVTTITARRFDPGLAEVTHRRQGATIAEIVAEEMAGATPDQLARLVVVLVSDRGEWEIYAHLWTRVRPTAGMVVRLHVRLMGRSVLKALLSVVILVAAAFLGPLVFPGFGAFGTAVFSALGTLALNALLPVEGPKTPDRAEERYSISGSRNEARPYGRVPDIHGKIRFYPPHAALPYTESIEEERYIRFLFNLGYADTVFADWKIGETPLDQYADHELSVVKLSPGDPWPFPGYANPVFETEETIALRAKDGWQTRRSARNVDFIQHEFMCDQGLCDFDKKGKIESLYLDLEIERREVFDDGTTGPWVHIKDISLTRETKDPFRFSHSWLEPHIGCWDHRVRRTTYDRTRTDKRDTVAWAVRRYTRPVLPVVFNRPIHLAYLRLKAGPQAQGVIDRINCVASSIRKDFDVPSGTWVVRETKRASAHALRILQGPANPYPIPDGEIRLADLEELARFEHLKELETNVVHDDDRTVEMALKQVLRGSRAFPTRHDGVRSIFIDRPQTLVRGHLAAVNASNFSGDPTYEEPVDALRVTFFDETDGYKQTERVVPRPGLVGAPQTFEEINYKVYTSPRLNWIEATRMHLERKYRWERFYAEQDAEHLFAPPGSLVKAHFTTVDQRQVSAEVVSVVDDFVVLSRAVTMVAGESYACRFRSKSGLSTVRSVITSPGETRSIGLTGPGRRPEPGELAMFGLAGQEAEEVIVKEVEPQKDLRARLTLVPHAPQIEAEAEANVPAWFPIIPIERPWADKNPAVPVIVSVTTRATIIDDDLGVVDPEDGPIVVVQVREGAGGEAPTDTILVKIGSEQRSVTVGMGRAEFTQYDVGDHITVTAQAFSLFNKFSAVSAGYPYTVESPKDPPPNVTTLSLTRLSDGTRRFAFEIDPTATDTTLQDVVGVRIYGRPGAGWAFGDLEPIHAGLLVASPAEMRAPLTTGPHVFACVAVDGDGLESATPILISKTIGASVGPALVVERKEAGLGWPGTITNGSVVAGVVKGASAGAVLTYRTQTIDLGADMAVDVGAIAYSVVGTGQVQMRTGLAADGAPIGSWRPVGDATARYLVVRIVATPGAAEVAAVGDLVSTVSPI